MSTLKESITSILESPEVSLDIKNIVQSLYVENVKFMNQALKSDNMEDVIPDIEGLLYDASINSNSTIIHELDSFVGKIQEYLRTQFYKKFISINEDRIARDFIRSEIKKYCISQGFQIKNKSKNETISILQKEILDYGVLTDLIFNDDKKENIEEIRVYDWNDIRYVSKGKEERTALKFDSPDQSLVIAEKMCRNAINAPMIKRDIPFVRLRMGNSIRVSLMRDSVARRSNGDGSPVVQMAIRKQNDKPFDQNFLIDVESIDEYGFKLIELMIKYGISTAFYGGTNSGKTGTMRAFTNLIGDDQRTITIAEIDEMDLRKTSEITGSGINSVLMWELAEKYGMDFRKLINAALTFTPETLILQEIKGSETVEVLDASTTGHQVITTLHAKNNEVFGKRMLSMYKQSGSDLQDHLILDLVADAFPIVIRMKIFKDGRRRISDIGELVSYDRSSGKFNVRMLHKFKVTDNIQNESGPTVIGHFEPVEFISEKLQDELLENACPKNELKELETLYNNLINNVERGVN